MRLREDILVKRASDELRITQDDSFEAIREKYRKLLFEYHPDRNPDNPEAAKKCKAVIEAYNLLCDVNGQSKTQEESEMERRVWELFKQFWPVPEEHQTSERPLPTMIKEKPQLEQSYGEFVEQRGFYDFVRPD